jgi:hypothetical protein
MIVWKTVGPKLLRGKLMAQQDASELLNALGPALRAAAKNVLYHAYGPHGLPWGTRFTDAEDMAVQVGDLLSREILQTAFQDQSDRRHPDAPTVCPCCSTDLDTRPDEPRDIRSRRGVVIWKEPAAYCPRCRRAFFPSVQEPGP